MAYPISSQYLNARPVTVILLADPRLGAPELARSTRIQDFKYYDPATVNDDSMYSR
jgi:hypothetical protein